MTDADKVTFELNKIVRGGVLESMLENGQEPEYRELDGDERFRELIRKIQEEAAELDPEDSNLMQELMDLQAAIDALLKVRGVSKVDFERSAAKRTEGRGGFEHAYYIGNLTLNADDPWVKYYRDNPERFHEV